MNKALEIAIVLTAVDKMNQVVGGAVSKAQKTIEGLNSAGNKMALGGAAIVGAFAASLNEAEQSEVAVKRLQQVYKSMGITSAEAVKQNERLASSLQMQIGIDDETIMLTQAKLATFKSLSSEVGRMSGIMDRATKAAFDMQATGFGEASQNAVQLGKALEDPIKGINSLRKSGITFTDAERTKIKTLVDSNKKLDAQQMIMKAIEKQVGGVAAATATDSSKMRQAWGEVVETVGKALLPTLASIGKWLQTFMPKVQDWIEKNQGVIKTIAAIGFGLLAVGTTLKILALVTKVVNGLTVAFDFLAANPIILIIAAIAGAAYLIYKYWGPIKDFFINVWEKVKGIFVAAWEWIKKMFLNYTPIGLIIKYWKPITSFFSNLWTGVKQKFWDFIEWIASIPKRMYQAGKNIIKSIFEGIMSMIMKPVEAIKNMVQKIRDFLPFSPAKVGPFRDLHRVRIVETIADSVKPHALVKAMKKTTIAAMAATAVITPVSASSGSMVHAKSATTVHYNPVIHINGSGSSQDFEAVLKKHEKNILKVIDEAKRKEDRKKY